MKKIFKFIIASILVFSCLMISDKVYARLVIGTTIMNDGGGGGTTIVTNTNTSVSTMVETHVAEFNAVASASKGNTTGISFTTSDGSTAYYGNGNLSIQFGEQTYTAYCLDPGLSMPEGNLTCKAVNKKPDVEALLSATADLDKTADKDEYQLAMRIWAAVTKWTQNEDAEFDSKEQHDFKQTVSMYHQAKTATSNYSLGKAIDAIVEGGRMSESAVAELENDIRSSGNCKDSDCAEEIGAALASKLIGGDVAAFEKSYNLAMDARKNGSYSSSSTNTTKQGTVSYAVEETSNEKVFKYTFESTEDIPSEEFRVDCINARCNGSWNGRKGTYTVTVAEGSCEATIKLYYPTEGSFECSTNSESTQTLFAYIDKISTEAVQTIGIQLTNVEGCEYLCCPNEPVTPGEVSGDVNNCCYPSTKSHLEEPALNRLFCKNETLDLEWWDEKCGMDYYKEEINDYCYMHCTESVDVELPGAITASSGRYFELTTTSKGTKSPYILGYKRCRAKVDLETWFSDYQTQLFFQVSSFNQYQENAAIGEMLEEMEDKEVEKTATVNFECKPTSTEVQMCTRGKTSERVKVSTSECQKYNDSYTGKYTVYTIGDIKEYYKIYQTGELDQNSYASLYGFSEILINMYSSPYKIKEFAFDNSTSTYEKQEVFKGKQFVDTEQQSTFKTELYNKKRPYLDKTCEIEVECTREVKDGSTTTTEDYTDKRTIYYGCSDNASEAAPELYSTTVKPFKMEEYKKFILDPTNGKITYYNNKYKSHASKAKTLEEDIDTCENYFTKTDPNTIYQFNAKSAFKYSQTYLDESGKLVKDDINVNFTNAPGCKITLASTKKGSQIEDPQYAEKYTNAYNILIGKNNEAEKALLQDLVVRDLEYIKNKSEFGDDYKDEEFELDKKSTHDGLLQAECYWNEGQNRIYTLAQSGVVARETTNVKNFTIHERQYQVHLTTLEGSYETFWDVSGLGSNGKFDKTFLEGETCANEDAATTAMFTCMLQVEHEVVLTGYCNGVTNDRGDANCDPFKEGFELVNFKVVDPADLFPSVSGSQVPSHEGQDYAHNWVVDPEGKEVLGIIEGKGAKDSTYAPENLSYSFTLKPGDMALIKEYNQSRLEYGGYTDFELTCDCPSNPLPLNSTESCKRCKSTFVENLSNGKVKINNSTNTVTGWSNKQESLGSVRGKNNW